MADRKPADQTACPKLTCAWPCRRLCCGHHETAAARQHRPPAPGAACEQTMVWPASQHTKHCMLWGPSQLKQRGIWRNKQPCAWSLTVHTTCTAEQTPQGFAVAAGPMQAYCSTRGTTITCLVSCASVMRSSRPCGESAVVGASSGSAAWRASFLARFFSRRSAFKRLRSPSAESAGASGDPAAGLRRATPPTWSSPSGITLKRRRGRQARL